VRNGDLNGALMGSILAGFVEESRQYAHAPQNSRRPGIGGKFTEAQKEQLSGVKDAVRKLLEIGPCADILGGKLKAQALLKGAQIFSANTINPAYKGPGYTVAQEARQLALGSNDNVAYSEVGGNRMYLNNRFFEIDTSPLPDPMPSGVSVRRSHYTIETLFIHELHRNGGYNGDWAADEDAIEKACGTIPSYRKTP